MMIYNNRQAGWLLYCGRSEAVWNSQIWTIFGPK